MMFSEEQIEIARQMRDAGLVWEPAVGHYVYDETGLIDAPSPFQENVYFILDMKHFLRRSGTVEELKRRVFWLPQWHQVRQIARDCNISDAAQAERLRQNNALESGDELSLLYGMVLDALKKAQDS
jgi:hypothetical protein